ncbi:MAG: hypothetical protein FWH27_08080 [Planctomycetaceae bacterium]|nr:hypothetical protein [Planctomycetaceae bacterium]
MKHWGFVTVMEHQRLGLIGGYLVLNPLGRPNEFHCTSPVRTTRPQEILYGSTLNAFLYGEQIAQILIAKAKIKPFAVVTDKPQVLAVQEFVEMPICYVCHTTWESEKNMRIDAAEMSDLAEANGVMTEIASIPGLSAFRWSEHHVGRYPVAVPELVARPAAETVDELKNVSSVIDFLEPFERIRLAIEEAQKAA